MPKDAPKKRAKAGAITKDLTEAKAYKRIRQEWINKRYKGKREKRAKEEEEKKK
eukprot:NODE_5978_length_539_cov_47.061224_g5229_i0.p3 GENE.NODE_5978_length_539_cov_47.061224_g5229_i0~~NODE_5978_length_539_cov_47.061224_g5229_i0.p3  ORF type:complete len:54 (-),score=16.01 NODE_5978_length_539_cov_47.061224_g5229_i0:89-250(-)